MHTPVPWRLGERNRTQDIKAMANVLIARVTIDGLGVSGEEGKANADLIVRAVNTHAALLAACEKAKKALETIKATGKIDWKLVDVGYGITELSAAIAAAKGE